MPSNSAPDVSVMRTRWPCLKMVSPCPRGSSDSAADAKLGEGFGRGNGTEFGCMEGSRSHDIGSGESAEGGHRRTSRSELVTDSLFCGTCGRPVIGFLLEVQAFCWLGGCLWGSQSGRSRQPRRCKCTPRKQDWTVPQPGRMIMQREKKKPGRLERVKNVFVEPGMRGEAFGEKVSGCMGRVSCLTSQFAAKQWPGRQACCCTGDA